MEATLTRGAPAHRAASGRRQRLNAADRLMLVAHQGMRSVGHAGFTCQSHVWLNGRIDRGRIRTALEELARRRPVITARIERDDRGPYWSTAEGAACDLREVEVAGGEPAVRAYAEGVFAEEWDLAARPPIRFDLLGLPDARDVLIVSWCHALMDGKSPELLLAELDRLFAGTAGGAPEDDDADELAEYLGRHGAWKRRLAALRVVASQLRLPVRSVTLEPLEASGWRVEPIRWSVRFLDESQTGALGERVRRLCGFSNLCPAVLASAFRTVQRLSPRQHRRSSVYRTDVPLNLRPPGAAGPVFRNLMSFISLSARAGELVDRDALIQRLHVQMRDQLRRGIDLGNAVMMTAMSRHDRLLMRHMRQRMQHHPLTICFGFLGPATGGLERLFGVGVERFYTLNSALSPPGMTLQVNQFRGRLGLAASYVASTVPDSQAEEFLDRMVVDLTGTG